MLTDDDVATMEAEIREQVEQAAKFADESPQPEPGELTTNVYANPLR
jgi:TPP-dependent pyruvate/acetoin dehydrogenase alpha subunit